MCDRVLGFIGARGGSKGIPGKNLRPLNGKPLIAYAIEAAQAARRISRCVVSTDDAEIMEIARQRGADVPFRRPAELATDTSLQVDAVMHAVATLAEQGDADYDVVCVIQPTAPLRLADDIDRAIEHLAATGADSVFTVAPVENMYPYLLCTLDDDRPLSCIGQPRMTNNRQAYPQAYVRNGAVYAVRTDLLMANRTLIGDDCRAIVMPAERSVNIDSPLDWRFAELLLQQGEANQARAA
jgi:CMP-N-acetylneuraminic acid synthetase